jgi:hypothetical protein
VNRSAEGSGFSFKKEREREREGKRVDRGKRPAKIVMPLFEVTVITRALAKVRSLIWSLGERVVSRKATGTTKREQIL